MSRKKASIGEAITTPHPMRVPASVLAWQHDGVVAAVQLGLGHREIGVFDFLAVDVKAVTVFAGQNRRLVGIDRQLPKLEFLGTDTFFITLAQGNFVEQPVGSGGIGQKLCAFGEDDVIDKGVAVKAFASGEMPQLGGDGLGFEHGLSFPVRKAAPCGLNATRQKSGASSAEG